VGSVLDLVVSQTNDLPTLPDIAAAREHVLAGE
jgi:hypothetical protein